MSRSIHLDGVVLTQAQPRNSEEKKWLWVAAAVSAVVFGVGILIQAVPLAGIGLIGFGFFTICALLDHTKNRKVEVLQPQPQVANVALEPIYHEPTPPPALPPPATHMAPVAEQPQVIPLVIEQVVASPLPPPAPAPVVIAVVARQQEDLSSSTVVVDRRRTPSPVLRTGSAASVVAAMRASPPLPHPAPVTVNTQVPRVTDLAAQQHLQVGARSGGRNFITGLFSRSR